MSDRIYGLLGRTLAHSWSVPIHRSLGCLDYRLWEREPEELEAFLAQDIGGLYDTIPYKRAVMPYCDEIDETAQRIGSVNTLVRRNGRLCAWNTDAAGFCFMTRRAGIDFAGAKTLVLGSGGASLTAVAMARELGAASVTVISRSGPDNYEHLSRHKDADLIVNTTPVGMYPRTGVSPVDLTVFPRCRGVLDLIYHPRRTALLLQAEELGIPRSDGLPMLAGQAAAAEELFFGRPIPQSTTEAFLAQLRRDKQNIVLIGMPGSGKSTVGAALAALTGRQAVDVDEEIVRRTDCSIPDLFARRGESAFRALELEETARWGRETGLILVTGGGVVKDPANRASLRQNGRVYHLGRAIFLLPREGRPLSEHADLAAMYEKRLPLYARFRDTVIDNDRPAEDTAAAIWRDFCEHSGD